MDPTHTAHALHKLPINHTQTSVTKRLRAENFVLEHRQSRACRTQSERTKAAQCKACTTKGRSHKRFDGLVTSYCIACAKTHDEPWYAAYTAAMRCAACGIGRRVHTKHGDRTTTYCMMCAEHLDAPWYAAYLAETRCTHCRTTKRATERYAHRTTTCCYACAEEHDSAWHAARVKANACTVCHSHAQSTEKHGGRATSCCVTCAEVHDPQWHTARVAATRCMACRIRARADKRYGERSTQFCIQCSEMHDAPWHAGRLAATRCSACGKNARATEKYANRKTTCCATCAEEHDTQWHTARVAATRCKACGHRARAHGKYNGHSTQCCISCSETHDAAWYEAWREAHACKTPHCLTYGAAHLKGFCQPCFATQYPTDARSRNYKSKEVEFARRIAARFPQFDWRFDKHVLGCAEPHGPRPDAMPTGFALPHAAGDVAYDVENDEYSHHDRTCESERRKLVETLRRTGKKHLVVFRFNQDEYRDAHGVRVPSCWGYDKATGRVRIVEKQRAQLDARFEKLFQVMAMYLEEGCRPPEDEPVFVIELFYDTVAGW